MSSAPNVINGITKALCEKFPNSRIYVGQVNEEELVQGDAFVVKNESIKSCNENYLRSRTEVNIKIYYHPKRRDYLYRDYDALTDIAPKIKDAVSMITTVQDKKINIINFDYEINDDCLICTVKASFFTRPLPQGSELMNRMETEINE